MKKLIAIAVVFALVTGAAFADTAISGSLDIRFDAIKGTDRNPTRDDVGSNPTTGGVISAAYIQLSGANDEGTVGATWRFRQTDTASDFGQTAPSFHRAFIWWKPIPQLRVFLGMDQDGMYSTGDALTDWQFHQGPESFLAVHEWDFWRAVFPGHWDGFGLSFNIYPVDGLTINLTIPTGHIGWPATAKPAGVTNTKEWDHVMFAGLKLQMNYNIPDIGKIFFAYDAPGAADDNGAVFADIDEETGSFGNIGASFLLEALSSMGIRTQIGIATKVVGSKADTPFYVGLGLHYTGEGFGVKFRTAGVFSSNANSKADGADTVNETFFTANIMPWYNLGFMRAYLDLGMSIRTNDIDADKRADNAKFDGFGWWITPYFKVPLGGPSLEFGLVLYGGGVGLGNMSGNVKFKPKHPTEDRPADETMNYAIPFRFVFNF
jgi:hypothetical protein